VTLSTLETVKAGEDVFPGERALAADPEPDQTGLDVDGAAIALILAALRHDDPDSAGVSRRPMRMNPTTRATVA